MVIQWSKERTNSVKNISKYLGSDGKGVSPDSAEMKPASANNIFKPHGKHVFTGKLAEHYLTKHGGKSDMMKDPTWVNEKTKADFVAVAVLEW